MSKRKHKIKHADYSKTLETGNSLSVHCKHDCSAAENVSFKLHKKRNSKSTVKRCSFGGRQRIGWRWRKKGVTLLSSLSDRNSSSNNTTCSVNAEGKCMIIDLTADIEDQICSENSLRNEVNIESAKHSDARSRKKTAKRKSSQPCRKDDKMMQTARCNESFNKQNSIMSDDFVIIDDSADEIFSPFDVSDTSQLHSEPEPSYVESNSSVQRFTHVTCDRGIILVMHHCCEVPIGGKSLVRCLRGKATILGHVLRRNRDYSVYCPSSLSLLLLTISSDSDTCDTDLPADLGDDEESHLRSVVDSYPVVVLLQPLQCHVTEFISQKTSFHNLFNDLKIGSAASAESEPIIVPETVVNTVENLLSDFTHDSSVTVAVCGGINTGKSTTCRYIVNRLLNVVAHVAYLDCDLGQTEFTPPGCVSLTLVSQPLLGPPFTHQQTSISCVFVGRLSPASCSQFYVKCLKHVYSAYLNLSPRPPLVINTMGWMKDVGLSLLVDTLRLTRPDFVIQLCNNRLHQVKHLPMMTPEFLASTPGIVFNQTEDSAHHQDYQWIEVASAVPLRSLRNTYNAASRRELAVLAYFGQLMSQSHSQRLSLRAVVPYRVLWTDIAIHVSHEYVPNSQILYALNGSIVALCTTSSSQVIDTGIQHAPKFLKRNTVCECLGFGIVRSISEAERTLFVITPLSPSQLERINCLQLGAIEIPSCLLATNEPTVCTVPYVDCIQKVPKIHERRADRRPHRAH